MSFSKFLNSEVRQNPGDLTIPVEKKGGRERYVPPRIDPISPELRQKLDRLQIRPALVSEDMEID